jgi:hypothetical protein
MKTLLKEVEERLTTIATTATARLTLTHPPEIG